eukprot:TRINITY_DN26689_c0_g2_i1.p1 TRINITY_DN26689_c0_g2~~TRINITY_DN26689_c0_g2_i1.p1  ORF type:complete len:836 (-),score=128.54 TRINITY_DN26689_c0_g2_i1:28-2355(-)
MSANTDESHAYKEGQLADSSGECVDGKLVVVIAGPTAVGKSATALELADILGRPAELVSADSVQLYRDLDIGSNKPSQGEKDRCPTHIVDWLEPGTPCNAGMWCEEALRVIDDMHERGVVPVVVGGSCMYLDWLVHGQPDAAKSDPEVLAKVVAELKPYEEAMDWEGALALLSAVDPDKAEKLSPNDWRRLTRQLEVVRAGPQRHGRVARKGYDIRSFFLNPEDRQALFHRIDYRCTVMLRKGLFEEVVQLLSSGKLDPETSAGRAIGYRQPIDYLLRPEPKEGDFGAFATFLQSFGTASRNYAVQQMHWFLRDSTFVWLPADPENPRAIAERILQMISLPRSAFLEAGSQDTAVREAQVAQGKAMSSSFLSKLDTRHTKREDLDELLRLADACTLKIPAHLRRLPKQPQEQIALKTVGGKAFGKVYWNGKHKRWGWGAPLGKIHRAGMQVLQSRGWQVVKEADDSLLPIFCWPARSAGDFPAHSDHDTPLPLIRPFPQEFTSRLDEKAELAKHLVEAGHGEIHPQTWTAEDFFAEASASAQDDEGMWFLKNTYGVKGQSVYPFADVQALLQRLEEMGAKGRRAWVVQRGISPPALRNGRKWVLRVHALLHGLADGTLAAHCHRDMILLEHGQPYTPRVEVRAAHISNTGNAKNWPKPSLLEDETLQKQVYDVVTRTFAAVWNHVPRAPFTPEGAELCHIFGFDLAADANGKVWLIEVNSYPAIHSGTMEHVDPCIYTNLVRDVLRLVVLPHTDGSEPDAGGLVRLNVEDALRTK